MPLTFGKGHVHNTKTITHRKTHTQILTTICLVLSINILNILVSPFSFLYLSFSYDVKMTHCLIKTGKIS
jgi:membrane protein YdbS with pleckstrin-like domain